MPVTFRKIDASDAAAISTLSLQLGYPMSVESTRVQISAIEASLNDVAWVAVSEDVVIGWIHVFYTIRLECPSYCEIGGLVVDKNYRGKHIGGGLIDCCLPWCREQNAATLNVRSNIVRDDAHAFYRRTGFMERKQQKVFTRSL